MCIHIPCHDLEVDGCFVVLDDRNIVVDDMRAEEHSLDAIGDQTLGK